MAILLTYSTGFVVKHVS